MGAALLLDTHTFLWLATDDPRLSATAVEIASDTGNSLWLSTASAWEIAIKTSLGKLRLEQPIEEFVGDQVAAMSLQILEIQLQHLLAVGDLPFHHRDPFDRLLVAQARIERMQLVSRDPAFDAYFDRRVW